MEQKIKEKLRTKTIHLDINERILIVKDVNVFGTKLLSKTVLYLLDLAMYQNYIDKIVILRNDSLNLPEIKEDNKLC